MTIQTRLMELQDYDDVYKLWMSCEGMGLNNLDDSREGISRFLQRNPDTCFVATNSDTKLIGVIMAGSDGRRGYIYHTSVHPNSQKMGIGKILVNEALKSLQQNGINKVALVVFEKNESGNQFWEKLGFPIRYDLVYRNKAIAEMIRIDT
ncbi:hypothetical protein P256_02561 [Acinetobacter nectaris CIP 110549]|uniref:N-acetyltransferase domain-containing protein n=1 Tax=Acinetobacter nectaris CIP 110549 TaxID=1392540 RepID=V2ULG9_9GAMM|nr:GNAT family N-acetyltransferase [Acinetobacter nectaris]ESK36254.1 hypothetical protein P256_02561 [Acinetobacter nectaris CIP 110549]